MERLLGMNAAAALSTLPENVRLSLFKQCGKSLGRWQDPLRPHVRPELDHVTVPHRRCLLRTLHDAKSKCEDLKLIMPRRRAKASRLF